MSLSEAILDVAIAMELEGKRLLDKDSHGDLADMVLRSFARELRIVVKAAGSEQSKPQESTNDFLMKMQLEEEKREMRNRTRIQENYGGSMVQCVGGSSDGVMTIGPPADSPFDLTKTVLGGEVYVFRKDGCMHFSEEETIKFREQFSKNSIAKK